MQTDSMRAVNGSLRELSSRWAPYYVAQGSDYSLTDLLGGPPLTPDAILRRARASPDRSLHTASIARPSRGFSVCTVGAVLVGCGGCQSEGAFFYVMERLLSQVYFLPLHVIDGAVR